MTHEQDARKIGAGPEVHAHDRLIRLRAVGFSFVGVILGFLAGGFAAVTAGGSLAPYYPFLGGAVGGLGLYGFVMIVVEGTGALAGGLHMPSGRGAGARRREYSFAESLASGGRFEDAISAFELAVGEHPRDPVPYLRAARINRDDLGRLEEAERWFRVARRDAEMDAGQERLVLRELVELYRRMGQPRRAAPELARLAEGWPGSSEGAWARRELDALKRSMASEGP